MISSPRLSILICAVPSRLATSTAQVFTALEKQAEDEPVEVLCLLDDRKRSIGSKRNALMKIARGEYVAFVDDDDHVSPRYVSRILEALDQKNEVGQYPDVVTFDVWVSGYSRSHGLADRICRYSVEFKNENLPNEYLRQPNHLMVWRSAVARTVQFSDTSRGEDFTWAEAMIERHRRGLREIRIEETLYYYKFDTEKSEAIGRRRDRSHSGQSELSQFPKPPGPVAHPERAEQVAKSEVVERAAEPARRPRNFHISTRRRPELL